MRTMYIAANNCRERGYYLGDVLTVIKTAWMFVENEPHEQVVLSLNDRDVLNFLWDRFIAENCVTVMHDRWEHSNKDAQYRMWGERLWNRRVKGLSFDTYKELYPRLDGGDRQRFLCGRENGLGRKNIFCYYYFGQQSWLDEPTHDATFGPGVIDFPLVPKVHERQVFVAPHEKCHGNAVFTYAFWEGVIRGLLAARVRVELNDDRGFLRDLEGPLLTRTFLPFRELVRRVAEQRLVVAGNNGIGWLAGAVGTPLLALERNQHLAEYEFRRCGVRSLVESINQPGVDATVSRVLRFLEESSDETRVDAPMVLSELRP